MMKISYYTWQTYTPGGIERVTVNKANYWIHMGHEVSIITREQKGRKPFYDLDPRIRQLDIDIDYQDVFAIANPISRWLEMRRRKNIHRQKLDEVMRELDADILVCTLLCEEAEVVARLKDRSKKVLESHGKKYALLTQLPRRGVKGVLQRLLDCIKRKQYERIPLSYDAFVVLTQEDRTLWKELSMVNVIPNAISSIRPSALASQEAKRVIAVGRLTYQKNFSDLIEIWARVVHKFPDWKLDIYGDGEERKKLEQEIAKSGVSDTLTIHPATNHIQDEYLSSSILTMTSRYEGFGMVLIEAQICGIPIVSYACPCGPRDVITDGEDGFLVPPGDRDLFVERLCQLMSDQELRQKMGQAASVNVGRFTEEHVMGQWRALFDKLLYS